MSHITERLSINDMIKAAAQGSADAAAITEEALRQLGGDDPVIEKEAGHGADASGDSVPTVYVEKLAAAVEFILESEKIAEPGKGPGALEVTETRASEKNIDAGEFGQALKRHQPPQNPPLQKDPSRAADPGTGLQTNDTKTAAPIALIRKLASSTEAANPTYKVTSHAGAAPVDLIRKVAQGAASSSNSRAHVDPRLVDHLVEVRKQAEDRINPARISTQSAAAPRVSASGEPGGAPVGGPPKGPTHLIASNAAAIAYKKREAKSNAKADAAKYVTEPVQSASTDKTLGRVLDHSSSAGVKISEVTKTAAVRALLEKLAAEVEEKAKKKKPGGATMFDEGRSCGGTP